MSFTNFRTSILCCVCCLFACSMSVNAQEFNLDLSLNPGSTGAIGLSSFDDDRDLFDIVLNQDTVTNSNELRNPITVDVAEESGSLELSILNATATSGIDGFGGDNRVSLNVTGLGIGITGPTTRIDPTFSANAGDGFNGVASSGFLLDGALDEFLTLSFNQDVIISAIGITNLDDGETFTFGSVTDITNDIDAGFEEDAFGNVDRFTFATPLEIAAGESILVGQSGVNEGSSGVGFEIITLQVADGSPTPAVPEPGSLAVLGLGGLLIATRRRRG